MIIHLKLLSLYLINLLQFFYSFNDYSINIGIIYLFLFLILLGVLSEILISTGATNAFQEWINQKQTIQK